MPEMGGFEATERIRDLERSLGKRTPIIGLTVDLPSDSQNQGGMDGFVSKPFSMDRIRNAIEEYVAFNSMYK
jgi:CheY-like chemotaxis protein